MQRAFLVLIGAVLLLPGLVPVTTGGEHFPSFDFDLDFDDAPRQDPVEYPAWFKQSFLDLPDDLRDAVASGKRGLVVYFGQKNCAYCHRLLNTNMRIPEIARYIRAHFDFVPINIWDIQMMTDINGVSISAREFAIREQANFTPTLLFYDTAGKEVFRLRGYHPPYQFRAAFEYVADRHYARLSFRDYLSRGDYAAMENEGQLNQHPVFEKPPFAFDRSHFRSERPLVVFFEQRDCHACDVLHSEPMASGQVVSLLDNFEVAQLDMWSDTPVLTPSGRYTTARQWAADLELFFAPTMVFFDEAGREVFRIDSIVHLLRLHHILTYVLEKGYQQAETYTVWRSRQPPESLRLLAD